MQIMHKDQFYKKTNTTLILFEVYLMLPVLLIIWHRIVGRLINELGRIWKDVVMTRLGYYSNICLEGMRKNHKNPQLVHSQLRNHDSNQVLSQIKVWGV
jgi:hypothetical protein